MKIAVIGGGMSGLACALRLQQAGHVVTVFERDEVPGGRMATVTAGGLPIDVGASLLLDRYDRLRALVEEVGLGDTWFEFQAGHGGVLEGHTRADAPLSTVTGLSRQRGLPLGERVRLLRFFVDAWREQDDLDFFDLGVGDDGPDALDAWTGTVEAVGEEAATHLIDPFVRAFHFHGARRLSFKYFHALASLLVRTGRFSCFGLRGFMGSLPRALAERLDVRTGVEVRRVAREGGAWSVEHAQGVARVDAVVLATTAGVARRVVADPPAAARALLDGVSYSSSITCSYRVPLDAIGDFEGLLVPFHESALIANCANDTCKGAADDTTCVVSLGLHDEAARELMPLPDDALLRLIAHEWGRLYPECAGRMTGLHAHRWAEALPVYGPGELARVKAFWSRGQGEDGLWLCGDYLNHPWLEGAVRCGEKVAARVGPAA